MAENENKTAVTDYTPKFIRGEESPERAAAYNALAEVVKTHGPRPSGHIRSEVYACVSLIRKMAEQEYATSLPPLMEQAHDVEFLRKWISDLDRSGIIMPDERKGTA